MVHDISLLDVFVTYSKICINWGLAVLVVYIYYFVLKWCWQNILCCGWCCKRREPQFVYKPYTGPVARSCDKVDKFQESKRKALEETTEEYMKLKQTGLKWFAKNPTDKDLEHFISHCKAIEDYDTANSSKKLYIKLVTSLDNFITSKNFQ
jgi:hypothetical protein